MVESCCLRYDASCFVSVEVCCVVFFCVMLCCVVGPVCCVAVQCVVVRCVTMGGV